MIYFLLLLTICTAALVLGAGLGWAMLAADRLHPLGAPVALMLGLVLFCALGAIFLSAVES